MNNYEYLAKQIIHKGRKNFRKEGTIPGISNEPYFSPYMTIQLSSISQLPQYWPLSKSRVFKQGCWPGPTFFIF